MQTCPYCHRDFQKLDNHLRLMAGRSGHPAGATPPTTIPVSPGVKMVEVPNVKRIDIHDARERILNAGFDFNSTKNIYSNEPYAKPGEVLRQRPLPGEMHPEGTLIELDVNKPPIEKPTIGEWIWNPVDAKRKAKQIKRLP